MDGERLFEPFVTTRASALAGVWPSPGRSSNGLAERSVLKIGLCAAFARLLPENP
jgi:hypothetical protein